MNSDKHIAMTGTDFFKEITYHIRWSPSQHTYGTHRARQYGTNGNFRDYVPFWKQPDARRIDLRQSLRNPFGEIYVRQSEHQSRIAVYIIADLSASMRFGEGCPKMRILRRLTLGLASSAHRSGDAFGFIGCDEDIRQDLFLPASVKRGSEISIVERLLHFVPRGLNVHGFRSVTKHLGASRKLIFLISDFHLPLDEIEAVLSALYRHDVVPIVLRCSDEVLNLPSWGLVELRDLETGNLRRTFMRPHLRERLLTSARERDQRFESLCRRYGRAPFQIVDRLDADRLSEHLRAG